MRRRSCTLPVCTAPHRRAICSTDCRGIPPSGAWLTVNVQTHLPTYELRRRVDGRTVETTDPGRALVSGRFVDVGAFKVPSLRGLAARPPYFHDGSAPDLGAVVSLYDRTQNLHLRPEQRADLAAFLRAL